MTRPFARHSLDVLRAKADEAMEAAMYGAELYARQADVVATLKARLDREAAHLAALARSSDELEAASREAARDVELADDPDGLRDATPEEAEEIMIGIFGPGSTRPRDDEHTHPLGDGLSYDACPAC